MIGFVYIWKDRRRKMFYLGSHVGTPDDGYVASSLRMRRAYAKRPEDFRRRLLAVIECETRGELHAVEQRWLSMIKPAELGVRYYNLKLLAAGGNGGAVRGRTYTKEQSIAIAAKRPPISEATRQKIASASRAMVRTASHREKIAKAMRERVITEEHRANIKTSKRGYVPTSRGPKNHTEETKLKMSESGRLAWKARRRAK